MNAKKNIIEKTQVDISGHLKEKADKVNIRIEQVFGDFNNDITIIKPEDFIGKNNQ